MNNLNSSPSSFSGNIYHHNDHQLQLQPAAGPNLQVASSSTCRIFISDQTSQDQNRYHQEGANLSYNNGSPSPSLHHHETMKNGTINIGLKLTLWKKEDHHDEPSDNINNGDTCDPLKWMSSKMRLMQKMKDDSEYSLAPKRLRSDNHKLQSSSSSVDTDSSSNGSHHNNNIMTNGPIRVCSDCNTTKTPLWRSGPKGPKSLCNACGIRQRKARRAMAAAAAANCTVAPPYDRIKLKDKKIITSTGKINGHASHLPKRCKVVNNNRNADASKVESPTSKLEDFLIKLSKNLAFHRVFPQDEKDAAILLMALSSGLVHG